ncbi:MAG: HU family DNA-binding protein [Spirochaetaceae bacterium]|nr:MAG: HU family DNA-binding protein [Spirochaetaceae bacterium]
MKSTFAQLPPRIQRHLESVTESSGLPPGEESLARLTTNWLDKRAMVEAQATALEMIDADRLEADDPRAVLLLTYSGSLIAVGINRPAGRWFEYASIALRADVPELVRSNRAALDGPIVRDEPASFTGCDITRSSDILTIRTFAPDVAPDEQERRLREATIFLTNGFVKLNQTLTQPGVDVEHFTMRSMVQYVARKNDVTQAVAKQVIDDYLQMVEAGALLGERVPLGRLGRLSLGIRAAQQARVGRNPATGEPLTIPAKPATAVPRFGASSALKTRAAALPVHEGVKPDDTESDG